MVISWQWLGWFDGDDYVGWDLYNKTLFLIPDITLFDWHQTKDAFLILQICQTFTYCDVISAFANYVTKAC